MSAATALPPLVKSVIVAAPPERAFDLFTAEIGQWWPLVTHSVGEESAISVTMECRLGGRIVETVQDGSTYVWGTITDWSPALEPDLHLAPGPARAEATLVTVSFRPDGEQTEVRLVHTGWDNRPDGARARTGYDTGWDIVLAPLAVVGGAGTAVTSYAVLCDALGDATRREILEQLRRRPCSVGTLAGVAAGQPARGVAAPQGPLRRRPGRPPPRGHPERLPPGPAGPRAAAVLAGRLLAGRPGRFRRLRPAAGLTVGAR